jgi:N-acetylmuramoyl-L-alanine amidase
MKKEDIYYFFIGILILFLFTNLFFFNSKNFKEISTQNQQLEKEINDNEYYIEKLEEKINLLLEEEKNEKNIFSNVMVHTDKIVPIKSLNLNKEEYNLFAKIVEAEAGTEGFWGKFLVANVIVNRIYNENFPNNLYDVITQELQFESYSSEYYLKVEVDNETQEAVKLALKFSYTDALYFVSNYYPIGEQATSFFSSLDPALTYKNHDFYY